MNLRSSSTKRDNNTQRHNNANNQFPFEESDESEESYYSSSSNASNGDSDDTDSEIDQDDYEADLLASLQNLNLDWEVAENFTRSEKIPIFRSKAPLKKDLSNLVNPEEFFELIVSDKFLTQICEWTNAKAELQRNRKKRESHEKKWSPLTLTKLKAFLGLLILMPLISRPRIKDYWSKKTLIDTPGIKKVFSRDDFLQIKKNIQLHNANEYDKEDPFHKIRPMLTEILHNTNENYVPPQSLALDETMIAFKGRSKYKVYMPLKPVRYGFKAFTVTSSEEPIVLNLSIYDGKKRDMVTLVGNMLQPFESKGHTVYMDRFYSMPKVFKYLEEKGIGACGTCLHNRLQLTNEMTQEIDSLQRKEFVYYESDGLLLSIWKDKKPVTVLSTVHKVKQARVFRKKRKEDITPGSKAMEACNIPVAISDYTLKARGVDIFDQYTSSQMLSNRSIKWYFRIFIFLLETAIINSWVLYKTQQQLKYCKFLEYLEYRRRLGRDFARKIMVQQIPMTPTKNVNRTPSDIEALELWGQCHLGKSSKKHLCSRCKEHETRFICEECNISLCAIPCYDLHRVKEGQFKGQRKVRILEKSA